MSAPSARRPPRRPRPALPATLVTLLLAVAVGACSSRPQAAPPPRPTPIGSLNSGALRLPRIAFCSLVPPTAVRDALGARPQASASWGNGDRAAVTTSTDDRVQELGCEWRLSSGARARAWVFAAPVTPAYAGSVVAAAAAQAGCRAVSGPTFGSPSSTQVCQQPGDVVRVRHSGLFGQTWLSCEVSRAGVPVPAVTARADAWCVQVAQALDGSSS